MSPGTSQNRGVGWDTTIHTVCHIMLNHVNTLDHFCQYKQQLKQKCL